MPQLMPEWSALWHFPEQRLAEYGITAVRILLIFLGIKVAGGVGRRLIDGILKPKHLPGSWNERRVKTVSGLIKSLLRYALYFCGGMMILAEVGVNTTSILAGAGVVGLAVGFGAQNLVRDVITGFFILFEDQYGVGDYISVAGITGTVEEMGLRVTRVRGGNGELHIIPNGEIKQVTNFSRGGMGVLVEVDLDYETDLDRATEVIEAACREVSEGNPVVVEAPVVLGVARLGRSSVTLQVFGKVQPMQQWAFGRLLRRQIKEALARAGIRRPLPRQVIVWRQADRGGADAATDEV